MSVWLRRSLVACACAAPVTVGYVALSKETTWEIPPKAAHGEYDVVIVGGGIVGCATAREILNRHRHLRVAVLEKEPDVARHQTGHNSGVIHAGIYYEPGSTMARLCVRGADLVYNYCSRHGLPCERVGKLIVACTDAEVPVLHHLLARGTQNGVKGLEILTGAQVESLEPNVKAVAALHSPNTGICDYGALCRSFAREVMESGRGALKTAFEVETMAEVPDGVMILGKEPKQQGPYKSVLAKNVITCCGLYSDKVAQTGGGSLDPKILPFRGTYYQMKPEYRDICKRNIYPVPTGGGIPVGVHFTPTCNAERGQQMIIGPGACLAFAREGYRFGDVKWSELWRTMTHLGLYAFAVKNPSMSVMELYRDLNQRAFLEQAQRLIPSLRPEHVEPSFSGVMAQVLDNYGEAAKDFIFETGALNGKVLHVRNAPSPACTASMAIAEEIVDRAEKEFGWRPVTPASKPKLAPVAKAEPPKKAEPRPPGQTRKPTAPPPKPRS